MAIVALPLSDGGPRAGAAVAQAGGAAVLLATFVLTVVRDLTAGIIAGCVLAALLALMHRKVKEEGA